jgi:hypothetical protein
LEGADVEFTTAFSREEPGDDATSFSLLQKSDHDGNFRLANLKDSPVDVEVSMSGYSPSRFRSVVPTEQGVDLDVRLEKGKRLLGTVLDESGAPLAGATVGLDVDPQGYTFSRTATTDGVGQYEFTGVGPGAHLLGLIRCRSTIVLVPVIMNSEEETGEHRRDIQLRAEGSPITVRFEQSDGSPAKKTTYRWAIDGAALPSAVWAEVLATCDYPDVPDADKLVLHGFPSGAISALSFYSQKSFGTFVNDGSQAEWIIRLPAAEEKRGERVAQGIPSPSD